MIVGNFFILKYFQNFNWIVISYKHSNIKLQIKTRRICAKIFKGITEFNIKIFRKID